MNKSIFVDSIIIIAGVLLGFIPFDTRRIRTGWAKLTFGIMALIWIVGGTIRLAWNFHFFRLGTDAFDRFNTCFCMSNGMIFGFVIALLLSGQFTGTKRD